MTGREDATGGLPVPDAVRDVVPAAPVYAGELVDDAPAVNRRTGRHRFMNWWLRSRHVPAALKSRRAARQAAKDAVVWLLRSPFRFVGSVGRGPDRLVACVAPMGTGA